MNKIQVLSTDVSNQIAAGEVVERPASVVKELIENAMDAGATSITIEIKDGGISYIRVTDNGDGMNREDAKTAFLRHATSKIKSASDLQNLHTLGFRGEALASIAAVSNVELLTKTKEDEGVFLQLEGGRVIKVEAAGCPEGTTIVVRNLFFNTPARMKFLKKDSTEASYITDIVQRLVLANPTIAFRYIINGKEKLFFSGDGSLKSCIYSIYGSSYAKDSAEVKRSENRIAIHGFVGSGDLSRGNRSFQSFFVNGRYIKNKSLTFAVENAFRNNLMVGKFPFFVIHIKVPCDTVDMNIHPSKQEVKFSDEKMVTGELYWAVKGALANQADAIRNDFAKSAEVEFNRPVQMERPSHVQQEFTAFIPERGTPGALKEPVVEPLVTTTEPVLKASKPMLNPFQSDLTEQRQQPVRNYKVIGQLFDTFIIIELGNKIVLIDQHAAHERMIYERLVDDYQQKKHMAQILLSPVAVSLAADEFVKVKERLSFFEQLGFEIEEFGNHSVLVRQAPEELGTDEIKEFILEVINWPEHELISEKRYDLLHSIACKAAIKGNHKLSQMEIHRLMDELLSTGGVNTCPHGRPIMIEISRYELEKLFKRIQS